MMNNCRKKEENCFESEEKMKLERIFERKKILENKNRS